MQEIYEKSPTRVDLAGGTLDCWPLYLFLKSPITINVAIDIFTHCRLQPQDGREVTIVSEDLKIKKTYASLAECLQDPNPDLELYRAHFRFWQPKQGFTITTKSESPVGGGLGGSSSLCISMLKAFGKWLGEMLPPYEMVRIASHIEAQILLKPTGTQDYFPPIFGGLNFIEYGTRGPQVEVKPLPKGVFERRFLLVYTGRSHHSGINNWQVIKSYLDGDRATQNAMAKLAEISGDMAAALKESRWHDLPVIFKREYQARTELSEGFSSPEIRRLQELASSKGAIAKICGAGGGGCVMIWCPDENKESVATICREAGFQVLPTQPWEMTTGDGR